MRVLGVSIAGGAMHLATLDAAEQHTGILGHPATPARRIVPSEGLSDAHRITDLRDRFKQDLRSLRIERVGLVETRLFAGWKYRPAFSRITAISAAMIAAVEVDIPYCAVKTETIARLVGIPAHNLKRTSPTLFGFDNTPTYWTAGLADAYGAAAALLQEGV